MSLNLGMKGGLGPCVLISYRTPAQAVRHLVPGGLRLVEHHGHAFWNIVICRIDRMRPVGLPAFLGITYHHVAYRLLVQAPLARGGHLAGLYFLRSDADSRLIATGGNITTQFRFHQASIQLDDSASAVAARVASSTGGNATFHATRSRAFALPPDSVFDTIEQSRSLLKYRPLGLSVAPGGKRVDIAQVRRDESMWCEDALDCGNITADWEYLRGIGQHDLRIEAATIVRPMPYRWQLGRQAVLAITPTPRSPSVFQPTD